MKGVVEFEFASMPHRLAIAMDRPGRDSISLLNPNGFPAVRVLFNHRQSLLTSALLEWAPPAVASQALCLAPGLRQSRAPLVARESTPSRSDVVRLFQRSQFGGGEKCGFRRHGSDRDRLLRSLEPR